MGQWLAVEWDAGELRALLARGEGTRISIDRAGVWPISETEIKDANALAGKLKEAIAPWNVGRIETILVLGRPSAEVRLVQVPPVEANDLPDVVRMQSLRQFSQMGENWAIDFAPLPPPAAGGPTDAVLASTLSPEALQKVVGPATHAGLNPTRVYLRPFATTALARKLTGETACRLFIDRLGSETDLIVATGDKTLYPRSVRLSAEEQESARSLAGESRRTFIAAANQSRGEPVAEVILFGDENRDRELAASLGGELKLPVRIVNPLTLAEGSVATQGEAGIGRFAPLVGACLEAASSQRSGIDFLNPRRPPPPVDRRRLYTLASGAAAAVALLVVGWIFLSLQNLDSQIAELQQKRTSLQNEAKKGKTNLGKAEDLEKFDRGDVLWLNELHRLATKLPPGDDVILNEMELDVSTRGQAKMMMRARLKEQSKVESLEQALRDEHHVVGGSGTEYKEGARPYPWQVQEEISLDPEEILASRSGGGASSAASQGDASKSKTKSGKETAKDQGAPAGPKDAKKVPAKKASAKEATP
jgi:Tfp pilus assembly PilM family ATPase